MELLLALCGIDVLVQNHFDVLDGARVALITNHTGLTRDGRATVDVLAEARNMKLVALFAPEHGIRGEVDEEVKDGRDSRTGLPVYSLYNPSAGDGKFRPTPAQLQGVDTMVYDVQDVGTRFYTYISTLGYAMEAAAANHLRFVVLDRPNPVGGLRVDGPVAEKKHFGFTAYDALPLVHGMTVGELAQMFKAWHALRLDLEIVQVRGWRRGQTWDQTGLRWVDPSPNMRSLTQAILYPGVGSIEAGNISVGRGTDTPFELFGAPGLQAFRMAEYLNDLAMPGLRFYPIRFTPKSSKFAGKNCEGVRIWVTDYSNLDPVRLGCEIAHGLGQFYPEWDQKTLVRLVHNDAAAKAMIRGGWEAARETWTEDLAKFKKEREKYLIYPE